MYWEVIKVLSYTEFKFFIGKQWIDDFNSWSTALYIPNQLVKV